MTVEGPDLAVVVVALQVDERPPFPRREARVDVAHGGIDLGVDLLVAGDARPAGCRQLDEDQALPVLGAALEEASERPDPLGQSLGVVEPLDADTQELAGYPEPAEEVIARGARRAG